VRAKHLEAAKAGERTDSGGANQFSTRFFCAYQMAEYQRIRQQLELLTCPIVSISMSLTRNSSLSIFSTAVWLRL